MRLWLDDQRPAPPGFDAVVSTARDAIDALWTGRVTYCSLDHDLDEGAGTGYDVARFLEGAARHGTLPRIGWNVHSANPVGAAKMIAALRNADRYWDQQESRGMTTPKRIKVNGAVYRLASNESPRGLIDLVRQDFLHAAEALSKLGKELGELSSDPDINTGGIFLGDSPYLSMAEISFNRGLARIEEFNTLSKTLFRSLRGRGPTSKQNES